MKIGIVTVYDAVDNLGSYLQAYALKIALEDLNHEVYFIQNYKESYMLMKSISGLRPIRALHQRILKTIKLHNSWKRLEVIKKEEVEKKNLDLLIYGSDEIWNLDNPYFDNPFFFGTGVNSVRKIAYAVSIGELKEKSLYDKKCVIEGIKSFDKILTRDDHTQKCIGNYVKKNLDIVCDPTFLVDNKRLTRKIKLPSKDYILVYTYGVDPEIIEIIIQFAHEKNLKIVSPCFWHPWTDITIQCDPLQMSYLMKHATYVFTTTFHGTIFTMLNHKKSVILPLRHKVRYVATQFGLEKSIIDKDVTYEEFKRKIEDDFPIQSFEKNLLTIRKESLNLLKTAIEEG